jgi:NDP-4-keto-2,6-dideoxyhexose 3-C-methyltransferase
MLYKKIDACRLCGGSEIETVLDLGDQALTGIFPKSSAEDVAQGPLELARCSSCGLVQLYHNYDLSQLYGKTYGYRSGLNQSMVRHLHSKVAKIKNLVSLNSGDMIIDIGSNDGTTLSAYPEDMTLVGVDPSGQKFFHYYPKGAQLIPEFFSAAAVQKVHPGRKAKVITSIAMFYDLEQPQIFVNEIASLLDKEGVWVFEQSYLPSMIEAKSYDTVCHEHLEFYAVKQIKIMLDKADLKIIDLEFNNINGGSFSITAAKKDSKYVEATEVIQSSLAKEIALGLEGTQVFVDLRSDMEEHRRNLLELLGSLKAAGKKVIGYGASTKGNVLIQYCGLTSDLVSCIAEVNPDKFGAYTPGSKIPIISEADAIAMQPDYYIVFPWHFRENIIQREQAFLQKGGKLIFPLPHLEIVSSEGKEDVDSILLSSVA